MKNTMSTLFLALLSLAPAAAPALDVLQRTILLHEDFASLDNWKPFYFPRVDRHSVYSIERRGTDHYLKAESNASASAIVCKTPFNVYSYPRLRWRWKIESVYSKGDPRTREGDDYPLRIYVMFQYDPERAGALERMKNGLAKKLYGEYPPHSSLSYVWANGPETEIILPSPYTDRAKMVLLEKGAAKTGTWQDEEVNIVDDYRKAFGADPPVTARIAVMNDADNTGEASVSYLAFIEVFK